MDDKKRPAPQEPNDAPPSKKQAVAVNGAAKSHIDADMPWKDELERYQKDAIYRQMQEYKREKQTLESRIKDMSERALYHDDHLRIVDAWFKQLLDEVKILAGHATPETFNGESEKFEEHLESRSKDIQAAIQALFSGAPRVSPDVEDLQRRLTQLLAAEKSHITELDRARVEQEQLQEQIQNASLRYIVAEKKLDRAKSTAVAKLERQATSGGRNDSGSGLGGQGETSAFSKGERSASINGALDNGEDALDVESAKIASAVSAKYKEQLEKLEAENEKLIGQLTTVNVKMSRLSSEDYAKTDLFKLLKSQHEDVINRVNDLQATNDRLREEAEKLQAERTAYRSQIESESQTAIGDIESRLARAENDLARVRNTRDELAADLAMRKTTHDHDKSVSNQIKELAAAKDERITALESQVDRLRLQLNQDTQIPESSTGYEGVSIEELQNKYTSLERQYAMLSKELPSMETAWKKVSALASQKVVDHTAMEEKLARLSAEKTKADQCYFGARKGQEMREMESRTLKNAKSKSSEIITQLKETEAKTRLLVINLEKQLAETKEALKIITRESRTHQQHVTEHAITIDGLKTQVGELTNSLKVKDTSLSTEFKAHRETEAKLEELKVRLEDTTKSLENWKSKGSGHQTQEYESLRSANSISKTQSSKPAVTYSAKRALTSGRHLDLENVPIAENRLG
ncbi:MAG: E3 ubiquitin-protein ligase bre1 [Candelina submexicana]|nr:MAG: E3 ubiquitin-protein ligase bre1 [Candelina submexicana]